jgi:hypothetical protein
MEKYKRRFVEDDTLAKINLSKEWKAIEDNTAIVPLKDWEELKTLIWKMQLKIEDLERSRLNWRNKYLKLKNG